MKSGFKPMSIWQQRPGLLLKYIFLLLGEEEKLHGKCGVWDESCRFSVVLFVVYYLALLSGNAGFVK